MKALIFGITLLCSISVSIFSSAQSVQKKGYIVLNNGDTLLGWIDYHNWEKNPSAISFTKDSLISGTTKYSKYDIQAVEITGFDRYIKAIIEKDTRPVTLGELLHSDIIDSLITDTVLLRVLVKGSQFDLYELQDNKMHFFIKKSGEDIKELKYRVNMSDDNTSFNTEKLYINQLKNYLIGQQFSADLVKKIDNADYREKDLSRIVTEINKISGGGTTNYSVATQKKKILTLFFVGAGGGYSNLELKGIYSPFTNMKLSGGFVPFATIGFDVSTERNLQAITLRLEASFSHASYSGEGKRNSSTTTNYAVVQTNISPTASLLFSFIRTESLKVYAGLGAAWNISSYGKNIYTETNGSVTNKEIKDYLSLPKTWILPVFKLGTKLNGKISVEIDGRLWGSFTNFATWSLSPQTFTGQFRYYF